ncbi:MAG TPA: DUF5916 domain-containing protein [Gemmatimonadaceae bacterium]|nr:DUF5916 domain-containing protein [Gemmatimonadaceae bacterium]
MRNSIRYPAAQALTLIIVASFVCPPTRTEAQAKGVHPQPAPVATAVRLTSSVSIDGKLDEEVWRTAPAITEFRQSQPDEGKPATQKTEVRFAYDDQAIYVGARMFDTMGGKGVVTRLLRRDALSETDSDIFQVTFDSYHDHSSRYNFFLNPSGAKRDGTGDPTWDPVWEGKAQIDSAGWTAELRIPFSQLNFSRDVDQTWGVQVIRFVHRLNERTHFAWWPNNEVGGPQRYGHLQGIKIAERPRGMELLPYTVGRNRRIRPPDPSNPFTKNSDTDYRLGGDLKYRLTSNLTLNATFNPDFGQVEVDPAVVNLSAFETFFSEKRPFFIEGQNAFGFGNFSCFFCSNVSNLQLFYTRRIGRSPQLFPSGTYVDQPENATILGAAKITGQTRGKLLLGVMDAVTRKEMADVITVDPITGDRLRSRSEVEPFSNYFVGRGRKDFQGGAQSFGGIVTSVDRFTSDSLADARLPSAARSLGIDWFTSWKDRAYSFMGQWALSDVRGSELAMQRIQRSSARYFQRPDRKGSGNGLFSDAFDENATRLTGYGGYARIAKDGGTWLWESMVNYRSPGFEVNDISFNTTSDYVWMNANFARSITKPGPIYRNYFAVISAQQQVNYDGDLTDREFAIGIFGQLRNFWQANAFVIRTPSVFDDRVLRGGPVIRKRGYRYHQIFLQTDARKTFSASINPSFNDYDYGPDALNLNANVTWKPTSNVQLSAGPGFNRSGSVGQFVTSLADPTATDFYGRRYIFAGFTSKQLSVSTRANVTFTPTLTFELFAQPLIFSGDYVTFNEFVTPRKRTQHTFSGDEISVSTVNGQRLYTIDPDGPIGPASSFQVGDPDFNFRSLRGNAVVRWEYRPGSTLYFVWQQNRADTDPVGNFDFGRDKSALFDAHPDNIFLVKASYWIAF